MNYRGYIIYRARILRSWSQAGLCKGICTVSYLSKIETGKAEPSEEILRLLLERLGLKSDAETEKKAAALAGSCCLTAGTRSLPSCCAERTRSVTPPYPHGLTWRCFLLKSLWTRRLSSAWILGSLPCSGFCRGGRRKRFAFFRTHILF